MKPTYTYRIVEVPGDIPHLAYTLFSPDGTEICRGQYFGSEAECLRMLKKSVKRLDGALQPMWSTGNDPEFLERKRQIGLARRNGKL